jgi:hypothetical protein
MPPTPRALRVTAIALNVRDKSSTNGAVVGQLRENEVVEWLATSSNAQWHQIKRGALSGWAYYRYLEPIDLAGPYNDILRVAAGSAIATYSWTGRGRAPQGYIKGMALSFGRLFYKLQDRDPVALEIAKASTGVPTTDTLAHYAVQFRTLGMSNDATSVDTLRHVFALMLGLGMRESSGRYCEGRDRSASNVTADTAEAGLFQTSWNIRSASPLLPPLFTQYKARPAGFREVFAEGVSVRAGDLDNFGSGDGRDYQELAKSCPAFAVESTAIGLRNRRQHWGPINQRTAELRSDADRMFLEVQNVVARTDLRTVLL